MAEINRNMAEQRDPSVDKRSNCATQLTAKDEERIASTSTICAPVISTAAASIDSSITQKPPSPDDRKNKSNARRRRRLTLGPSYGSVRHQAPDKKTSNGNNILTDARFILVVLTRVKDSNASSATALPMYFVVPVWPYRLQPKKVQTRRPRRGRKKSIRSSRKPVFLLPKVLTYNKVDTANTEVHSEQDQVTTNQGVFIRFTLPPI